MAIILEERFFSPTGQLLKCTNTPLVTNPRRYARTLRSPVIQRSFHRYEGKRGICFLLQDGTIRIVILGMVREVEATASPVASITTTIAVAAD